MPCWYYEKKEIKNSPSYRDGIDTGTEARYRREGARFIVDAGTKLGLRYDTCATGVVYFHRFYMFHSFKEFPRHVTAACCLFLAGKVEETPKKCKDIIKISQQILTAKQFSVFGNDPKEEVMTLERILLQTIKFDLQTEHPYAYLLKFAKHVKADKEKVQKLVQMSWTFINDSLCTTLSLQWEPEIIGASLMYLGTRLNKFEITDWNGRVPGTKQKWWECLVEDLTVELMEDICHQVLDLYSPANQASAEPGESPPPPPPAQPNNASRTPNSQTSDRKRSLQSTPSDPLTPGGQSVKSMKMESGNQSRKSTPQKRADKGRETPVSRPSQLPYQQNEPQQSQATPVSNVTPSMTGQEMYGTNPQNPRAPSKSYQQSSNPQYPGGTTDFSQYNPYVSAGQYQSSFLSGEGARSLQTIMGTQPPPAQAPNQPPYSAYSHPPPPVPSAAASASQAQYGIAGGQYPPGYNPSQYPASAAAPGPPVAASSQPFPPQNVQQSQQQFQGTAYPQYSQYPPNYQQPPPHPQQPNYEQQAQYPGQGTYPGNQGDPQQPNYDQQAQYQGAVNYPNNQGGPHQRSGQNAHRHPPQQQARTSGSALATVRITGR